MATEKDDSEPLLRNLARWKLSRARKRWHATHAPSFFDTSNFADCVIHTDKEEFKLHRVIMSAQSDYFKTAFNGKWKESSGTVILKGDDANAVKAMLKFMYTSDYDAADNSSSPMVFNAIVYRIADKYMVPALKSLAQRKIQELVSTSWDSDDFTDYIAQLYNLPDISDQVLREMVIEVVRKHNQQLVLKPKFCDILNGTAEFASDLAMCMITKGNPSVVTHRCAWCEQTFDCRQCHSCSDTWNAG